MNKFVKNVICIIGIILLTIVLILNLLFNTTISVSEAISININNILYFMALVSLVAIIYILNYIIKEDFKKIKKKYLIFGIIIFIYVTIQIIWVYARDTNPAVDQKTTYDLAVAMKENNVEELLEKGITYSSGIKDRIYLERYNQQFTNAFVWSLIFRFFNSTNLLLIQYFNIICNAILAVTIFMICKELSFKYEMNKYLALFSYLTFITIPLLSTFIYGDLSGMCFAMLGVYFIMKYTRTKSIKNILYSAILTAIAYMLRMNILIFIIAMIIYLLLDLISQKERLIKIFTKILIILSFIVITIAPSSIIKNYFCNKYNLKKENSFPLTGYILMGMQESSLAEGWYDYNTAYLAYQNIDASREIYKTEINNRIKYFRENPKYTIKFYIRKISSMWTETTFAGVRYNLTYNFGTGENKDDNLDKILYNINGVVSLYQKAIVLIIFTCSIIAIIQKRKNISNERIKKKYFWTKMFGIRKISIVS